MLHRVSQVGDSRNIFICLILKSNLPGNVSDRSPGTRLTAQVSSLLNQILSFLVAHYICRISCCCSRLFDIIGLFNYIIVVVLL